MFQIFITCMFLMYNIHSCSAVNNIEKEMQEFFHRDDLRCPDVCNNHTSEQSHRLQCCVCNSNSVYEHNLGTLKIKYLHHQPGTELVCKGGKYRYYELVHRYGNLTELPINTCEFENSLFRMDLSYNKIHNITGISCLQELDTLILRGNNIQHIRNEDIVSLKHLRSLDLAVNNIKYIDPGLMINVNGSLFNFDVSHNNILFVEITNFIMEKQQCFCKLRYAYNKIQTVINTNHWSCRKDTSVGFGGMIDLSNNFMVEFFDVQAFNYLGFYPLSTFGRVMYYGIDVRNNTWHCDCKFFPYADLAKRSSKIMERDYFKVKCSSPPEMRDTYIIDLLRQNELNKFICNISMVKQCPPRCHCFYQPATRNRTVVNCSSSGYWKFPAVLPSGNNLEVDFSRNKFHSFPHLPGIVHYFPYITILNMTKNKIRTIVETDFNPLKTAVIDLRDNPVTEIPRSFEVLSSSNIFLYGIKKCRCSDKWLQEWLPNLNGQYSSRVKVMCITHEGLKPIQILNQQQLGCVFPKDKLPFFSNCVIIGFISVLISAVMSFTFRYELFLIVRARIKSIWKFKCRRVYSYDCYIAHNEEDLTIRQWILTVLLPYLSTSNLNVFWPCLHSRFGAPREEEIIDVMSKCRTFLIILSANYNGPINWYKVEWKHAWHNVARDINRELIIVNYDMVSTKEIHSKYISAFLCLGMYIDFANQKKCIENEIKSRILKRFNNSSYLRKRSYCEGNEMKEMDEGSPLLRSDRDLLFYGVDSLN